MSRISLGMYSLSKIARRRESRVGQSSNLSRFTLRSSSWLATAAKRGEFPDRIVERLRDRKTRHEATRRDTRVLPLKKL